MSSAESPERSRYPDHYLSMRELVPKTAALLVSFVVVAITIIAVRRHAAPTPLAECRQPDTGGLCDTGSCGANSPVVNGFPLNGLRPNGDCNPDGVQLVPGSILNARDSQCNGTTLSMDENRLVALAPDHAVVCQDAQLLGATFAVRSWAPISNQDPRKRTARIRIASMNNYSSGPATETRIAYRLVRANDADNSATLCNADESLALRQELGLPVLAGLAPSPPENRDGVIPVFSELYDATGQALPPAPGWTLQQREWMNLACVHDSLAKRSMYRLFTDNYDQSRAALNMLTANYCGFKPMTMRGVGVSWSTADSQILEAQWSTDRALCVGEPRVLYKDGVTPAVSSLPDNLRLICSDRECPSLDAWRSAARTCVDKNRGIFLTLPDCASCDAGRCGTPLFNSYVIPGPVTP